MSRRVLLLDGKHTLHRASETHRELTAMVDGEEVGIGAVYGFLMLITGIQARHHPDLLIVCWEGGATMRRKLYPAYKPLNEADPAWIQMRQELERQRRILVALLGDIGAYQCWAPGWEADDAMGTLAARRSARGDEVIVYTGDGDLQQCLAERVSIVRPVRGGKEEVITVDEWTAARGYSPSCVTDLKGLGGDSGDNIPGATGIGAKWADRLVSQYGSAEAAIEAAEAGQPLCGSERMRDIVCRDAALILMSKLLATIHTNAEIRWHERRPDRKVVMSRFLALRFKSLMRPGPLDALWRMGHVTNT